MFSSVFDRSLTVITLFPWITESLNQLGSVFMTRYWGDSVQIGVLDFISSSSTKGIKLNARVCKEFPPNPQCWILSVLIKLYLDKNCQSFRFPVFQISLCRNTNTLYRVPTFFLSWNSLTFPVFLAFFPDFFPKVQTCKLYLFKTSNEVT